jgi:hypothetical protein
MQNAHHRLAIVKYTHSSKNWSTDVSVWSDRFATEAGQTHMLSIFGNATEISAVSGAISNGHSLHAISPEGNRYHLFLGDKPTSYRSHITLPGRARPIQHMLFFSQKLMQNGMDGIVYVLHDDMDLIWSTVVSFLGLPACPQWAVAGVRMLRSSGKIKSIGGLGCTPVAVTVNREFLLTWMGEGVRYCNLAFPEKNGPIAFKSYGIPDLLAGPQPSVAATLTNSIGF